MLKTLVMTTGEFEFDTIYLNDEEFVEENIKLSYPVEFTILWIVFIIMMPVLFSNLLVSRQPDYMHICTIIANVHINGCTYSSYSITL